MAIKSNPETHAYEKQANSLLTVHPSDYEVGSFIWGIEDEWTEEYSDFKYYMCDLVSGIRPIKRLCKILRIEDVNDLEKDAKPLLLNWEMRANEGSLIKEKIDGEQISYLNCAIIRDKAGRYIIVTQPFLEVRLPLCFLPVNWRKMFSEVVRKISENPAVAKYLRRRNAWVADRNARCRKWSRLLKPVPKGISICDGEYFNIGMENVATMAKSAFPRVQFSASYAFKWDMMKEFGEFTQKRMNGRYILEWKNGPTEDEVKDACDFELFNDNISNEIFEHHEEFMDFANKFGGVFNEVELKRKVCDCDKNGNNSIEKRQRRR